MTALRPALIRRAGPSTGSTAAPWGFSRVSVPRFGVTRFKLVVLPPGSRPRDLRRVRAYWAAPSMAAATSLITLIAVATWWTPLGAIVAAVAAFVVALLLVRYATSDVARTVHELDVVLGMTAEPLPSRAEYELCVRIIHDLKSGAAALRRTEIDAVTFEARWGAAWSALASTAQERSTR